MTAFLIVDVPRAPTAPLSPRRHIAAPRPVLSARWLVAPDGHLTCRWQADDPAPDRPPL